MSTHPANALSPILLLQNNIIHEFENPNGSAVGLLREAVDRGLLSHELNLLMDAASPTPPRVIKAGDEPAYIQLHVSHLELLWAFIYGWIVLYEEAIQRPWIEGRFDGRIRLESELTNRAASMLEWASSLRHAYSPWPQGLPTPGAAQSDKEYEYALKTNGIFQSAVAFLLFHEFGHVRQGHFGVVAPTDNSPEALAIAIQLEREADQFAFDVLVSQHDDEQTRVLKGWAVLAPALSSLYLLNGRVGVFQKRHPHLHHRIQDLLAKLRFEDERHRFYYHYLCSTVLGIFDRAHRDNSEEILEPRLFQDVDEAFDDEMNSLDEFFRATSEVQ